MKTSQFPVIRVSGSARDRGRQIGSSAAQRIARSIEIYQNLFQGLTGLGWDEVVANASRFRPAIEAYDPRYLDEIQGMAEGANLNPADVLAINIRTEIRNLIKVQRASRECTAFTSLPGSNLAGQMIIGQNWDWYPATSETVVVLEVEQEDGPKFVTVVEAGLLAKTGFNSAGIGLVTNGLVSDQDLGEPGVPYHVILRGILDSETMADAFKAINRHPRASAANYLIANRDGEAINFETAPGSSSRIYATHPTPNGVLAHTNHYTCETFDLKDVSLVEGPDSLSRLQRVENLLEKDHGQLDLTRFQGYFSDHLYFPDGICTHPDTRDEPILRYQTVASIIMNLNLNKMWLADGNPCEFPYREIDYRSFFDQP
jgi:isopenicillin-N N-acyltransferase-like protein